MLPIQFPEVGDVIFFRKSPRVRQKLRHSFISFAQRLSRVKRYEFIHAAILISPFEIADATVGQGVSSRDLFEELSSLSPNDYVVLRKPLSEEAKERIRKAAFYFYKESYDFGGLARLFKKSVDIGRSICSVFVKKVLVEVGLIPSELWAEFPAQIFVGELFELLTRADFLEISIHVPQDSFGSLPGSFALFEQGRETSATMTDYWISFPDFGVSYDQLFDLANNDGEAILRMILLTGSNVLKLLENEIHHLDGDAKRLKEAIAKEATWRDRDRRAKSIKRGLIDLQQSGSDFIRIDKAIHNCFQSSDFDRILELGERIKAQGSSLQPAEIAMVAQEAYQLGARSLAHIIQLTGCESLQDWRRRSSRFLRRIHARQNRIEDSWKALQLDPPNCYVVAKYGVKGINARIAFCINLLLFRIDESDLDATCEMLVEAARTGLTKGRQVLADSGIPVDQLMKLNAMGHLGSDDDSGTLNSRVKRGLKAFETEPPN